MTMDFRSQLLAIKGKLKKLDNRADNNSAKDDSQDIRIDNVRADITALKDKDDKLSAKIDKVKADIADHETRIAVLEAKGVI